MELLWSHRLRLWHEFLQVREEFSLASRECSIRLSELRQLTFRPQIGDVVSSPTGEKGRIVRVVREEDLRGNGSNGVSFVVAVPAASPKRQQLWKESEIKRNGARRSA
jgi:hypothetical protein